MILIRSRRTSQPQTPVGVDWANPITRGLFFAWNAPARTDAVSRRFGQAVGSPLAPSARGLYAAGNSSGYAAFPDAALAGNQLTVFSLWYPTASDYQENWLFGLGKGFVSRQQFMLYQAGSNVYADINGGSPGNRPFNAGVINSAAFVVDSGVSSGCQFVVNNSYASPATTTLSTLTGPQDIEVLRNVYAWGISPSGGVMLTLAWNRLLRAAELTWLHLNPWSVFAPQRIQVPVASAGIVTPTLTAASVVNIGSTFATPRVYFTR